MSTGVNVGVTTGAGQDVKQAGTGDIFLVNYSSPLNTFAGFPP